MSTLSKEKRIELPSLLPFLMNMALAFALAAMMAGWQGVLSGAALMTAVFAFIWLIGILQLKSLTIRRIATILLGLLCPIVGIVLCPIMLSLRVVFIGIAYVWQRKKVISMPEISVVAPIKQAARSDRCFVLRFFTLRNLPWIALNLLLLLMLGCVAIGIEVAFYATLATVLIMILTLVMVALESNKEPE